MTPIIIEVSGIPQTAGSKRAFPLKKNGVFTGRNIVVDANPKAKDWKNRVADAGSQSFSGTVLLTGPLEVHFLFRMPRIASHYRSNGELKPNAPARPIVRPDALKLARCAEDALTGVVWRDDSQIVIERLEKIYDERPGLVVTITPLEQLNPEKKINRQAVLVGVEDDCAPE